MPILDKQISEREGYKETAAPDAVQRDLGALARKHNLTGCVLVQFSGDRVGVRSWGVTDEFCDAMDTLATRILTDIDNGRHDPLEHIEAEGRA